MADPNDHGSVFDESVNEVRSVDEIVRSRLRDAVDTMHLLQEKAVGAIDKLGGLKFDVDVDDPPRPPGFDPDVDFDTLWYAEHHIVTSLKAVSFSYSLLSNPLLPKAQ